MTTLVHVRTTVMNKERDGGKASIEELKKGFRDLAKAADDKDWNNRIRGFGNGMTTAKNAVLLFLQAKTGLKPGTLEKRVSTAKKQRKKRGK